MILREIVGDVDGEKDERLKRAKEDFFFFAKHYFPHLCSAEFAEYQKILIEIINENSVSVENAARLKRFVVGKYRRLIKPIKELKGIIDVEPRGHGKSTRMSVLYPLWRVLSQKSNFVVIFSSSEERAAQILDDIKFELENNERLIGDFNLKKGRIWKANFIELNGAAIASRGALASTRGLKYRQFRPDLVIADDVIKDDAVNSKTQRDKVYNWFKRVVMPLGKDVFIVLVNTIFHADDMPSRLLKELDEGKLKGWLGLKFSAIINSKPLWDTYWTLEDLERKRLEMGSVAFSTEYMNEPLADEDRLFRDEWLVFDDKDVEVANIIMGVDPALGGGDYSAIAVIGVDREGFIHVLDARGYKLSPDKFMDKIIALAVRYKPKRIVFEEVAFQRVMKDFLVKKAAVMGVYLPIKGVKPGRVSKEARIARLSPLVENGILRFKRNQTLLLDQLLAFPKGDHDDLVDALAYAVEEIDSFRARPKAFRLNVPRYSSHMFRRF